MGSGPSYEKEYRDTQEEIERVREQIKVARDERKRVQEEKDKYQAEVYTKELQRLEAERERELERGREEKEKFQETYRIQAEKERELKREREEKERLQEAYRIQAEKDKALAEKHEKELRKEQEERERLRQEANKIQAESHARELRRVEEEKERLQEAHKIQAEKDRALAKQHEQDMQKAQEEREKIQNEKDRIQAESHEKELRRVKAEKEEELRRAEEEKKRIQEAHRMQEELRKLQEKIRMEEQRKKMEELARRTEEEGRKRVEQEIWLRKEAERNLEEGIPAVKYPTGEEFQAMREKHKYEEGYLHIAITGVSGSGKSSLINALRGCSNSNSTKPNIAKTGTSETTEEIKRYYDPHPSRPWLIWYDVPGAGTVKVRDWQYFNDQGLYIFDVIIIVIGDRFTKTDVELLFHCKRFGIPAFVVRSKADQHIRNIMNDDDGDSDDDDENRFTEASNKFIADTRKDFKSLLQNVGLPQQKVYIVSKKALHCFVKGTRKINIIDEVDLVNDVIHVASERYQNISQ